jgi:SAM-dependent methyltransferase
MESTIQADTAAELPRALNLGSGKSYDSAMFNVDINAQWQPDAIVDIAQTDAFTRVIDCGRFGKRLLPRGYFERIDAFDVLEHVPHLTTLMANCLEVLAEGGRMNIHVPYDLSLGAWQDPTHVRAFNQNSWLYYTEWYWYLGWEHARFETENLTYVLSALGDRMQKEGAAVEDIIGRPRAVDAMHVVLRKRALTADEAAHTRLMAARKR